MNRPQSSALTRKQMHRIFKRHYGASNRLANELGKSRSLIAQYFRGTPVTPQIEAAIRARATELLASERQENAA